MADRLVGAAADQDRPPGNVQPPGQVPPEGQRLQRGFSQGAPVVVTEDEQAHRSTPSSSNRSTTAPAASGPVPRITVSLTCSSGR